ncbi:DNA repair protein complementing XP-C cells homolog isoform X2 [Littorina saxatilis]|uniref:DNA repair protein complementing XP-C cells homolog n=1 Tax=Littorina saxatilis TaxID=31220 RepID=A0AAN9BEU5_9CAEN
MNVKIRWNKMPGTRITRARRKAETPAETANIETVINSGFVPMTKKSVSNRSGRNGSKSGKVTEDIFSKSEPEKADVGSGTYLKKTGKSKDVKNQRKVPAKQKYTDTRTEEETGNNNQDKDGNTAASVAIETCLDPDSVCGKKRKSDGGLPEKTLKKSRQTKETMGNGESVSDNEMKHPSTSAQDTKAARTVQKQHKFSEDEFNNLRKIQTKEREVEIRPDNKISSKTSAEKFSSLSRVTTLKNDALMSPSGYSTDSVLIKTEESSTSSSDSDFEEVQTQYRTPETSSMSNKLSDSGICRKLEESFSDFESSPGPSSSFSSSGNVASFNSPSFSTFRSDSGKCSNKRTKPDSAKCKKSEKVKSKEAEVNALKVKSDSAKSKKSEKVKSKEAEVKALKVKSDSAKRKKSDKVESKEEAVSGHKTNKNKESSKRAASHKRSDKSKAKAALSSKKETKMETNEDDIMALLMQMEGKLPKTAKTEEENVPSTSGQSSSSSRKKTSGKRKNAPARVMHTDCNEESDWEEVEDYKHSPFKSQIPDAPVQITIDDPGMLLKNKKRKKKEFDWQAYVQRKINRLAREIQVDMHKTHLLCLLSHSMQQNSICCDEILCATAFSIVPMERLKKNIARYDQANLLELVKWFKSVICLAKAPAEESRALVSATQLSDVIRDRSVHEARQLVMGFIAVLRAMGFNVRLVMSLHPLPLKASHASASKSASAGKKRDSTETKATTSKKPNQSAEKQKTSKTANPKSAQPKAKPTSKTTKAAKPADKPERKSKQPPKKTKPDTDFSSSDSESEEEDRGPRPKRCAPARPKKVVKPSASKKKDVDDNDESGDDVQPSSDDDGSNFSEEEEVVKKKARRSSKGKGKKSSEKSSPKSDVEGSDSEFDDSFNAKSLVVEEGKHKKKANRKVLSDDSSAERMTEHKVKSGRDYWLEVFLPAEGRWICVDCVRTEVNKPYDICGAASQPLLYVLGFENDGSVKDITARYAPQWLTHTRKQRVDSEWWRESLEPFGTSNEARDDQENKSIKAHLTQRPLPTSIGEFKNHPMYALRRHLLKYEALYPESSIPVGYIRKEPVYARECVHTLHSRDNWLKEARLVRLGETAYKRVKSIKRWNRGRDMINPEELDLELFGYWQTEEYIPPIAVNGKVPKNEYGNVEMFQPSMLPGGTVHLKVPALNRVAKKLGIDIAAAFTGWDNHCGFSHPLLDGWIVCEEHKDILLAAWEEDQEIQRQKEEEKREKRVLTNWTTLVKGLLIKERLKKKFNLEDKVPEPEKKKSVKEKKGEKATDVQHAWPAKQQHGKKTKKDNPPPPPSHYTVETM